MPGDDDASERPTEEDESKESGGDDNHSLGSLSSSHWENLLQQSGSGDSIVGQWTEEHGELEDTIDKLRDPNESVDRSVDQLTDEVQNQGKAPRRSKRIKEQNKSRSSNHLPTQLDGAPPSFTSTAPATQGEANLNLLGLDQNGRESKKHKELYICPKPTQTPSRNAIPANEQVSKAKKKNDRSSGYKCNKCGQKRKGHICPFDNAKAVTKIVGTQTEQQERPETKDVGTQTEEQKQGSEASVEPFYERTGSSGSSNRAPSAEENTEERSKDVHNSDNKKDGVQLDQDTTGKQCNAENQGQDGRHSKDRQGDDGDCGNVVAV